MNNKYSISKIILYLIALIFGVIIVALPPSNILSYDVFGYYMYLPLTFNYHDILLHNPATIESIFAKYHISETFYQAFKWENTNNWVIRYPIGLAVLYSPFYFLANIYCHLTNYPNDGFSTPYQISILFGCYFYTLLGLYYLRKTLLFFFNDITVAITLFALALGTNYFFHVSFHGHGAMSHNLVFTLISCLLYFTIKWNNNPNFKYSLIVGAIVGLIAISRATEIVVLIIPFLFGVTDIKSLKRRLILFVKNYLKILSGFLAFIIVLSIQLIYWKYSTNKFFINAYGCSNPGEGLEPLQPHILEVLFSFRKGLFIYVPMMLFALVGFFMMSKEIKPLRNAIIIYVVISIYIISCWSCWWYGSCFGNRALIPIYVCLCIPLAAFFEKTIQSSAKYIVVPVVLLFVSLNVFQSWQMHKGIMDSTNMSKSYYVSTFLQTSPATDEQKKLLLPGKFDTGVEVFTNEDSLTHQKVFNQCADLISITTSKTIELADKSPINLFVFKNCSLNVIVKDVSKKSNFWIKANVSIFKNLVDSLPETKLGVLLKHKGYVFKNMFMPISLKNQLPGTIKNYVFYYWIPDDLRSKNDEIVVYFSGNKGDRLYFKDFCFEVLEPIIDKSVFY